jgi:hypothetical protein
MQFDDTQDVRIAGHEVCVVFDRKTGKVAHIHESVTYEGAEPPSKDQVASRAMELSRQLAAKLPGVKVDQLEVLHVRPDELIDGSVLKVNVRTRQLIATAAGPAASRQPRAKRAAPKRTTAKRR